ncbi:unnamed protein product [Gordionus sp. m RMFG-2023]
MNLDNASFIRLNWTLGDFNQSKIAEVAISPLVNFYVKYGLLLLALHGMLGNTVSLACLAKMKIKNSRMFLILLRLIGITNICVSSTYFGLWLFRVITELSQNLSFVFITAIYSSLLIILQDTFIAFQILLIIALSLDRYAMISCFYWHRNYCVARNVKYILMLFTAIILIIMFPAYRNYFQIYFDLLKHKVNVTNKRNIIVVVFTRLNLDGSKGYILYEIFRELFLHAILLITVVFIKIRYMMKIKRFVYQRNRSAFSSLALLKEGNRNQTLLMCLLCFQTVCVLPNSSYNFARYLNPRWILSHTEGLVLMGILEPLFYSTNFYIYAIIYKQHMKSLILTEFKKFIRKIKTVANLVSPV